MGKVLTSLALVLLLTACAGPGPAREDAPSPPAETAQPEEPAPAAEGESAEGDIVILDEGMNYPVVPETTAETYGLEGRDAALFAGAMAQFEGFEKPSEDLWLPNAAVLEEYEENGDTVVIAWIQIWQLYGYQGPDVPMTAGGGGNYAVMRLREQKEGVWECREAVHNYFSDPEEFLLENCGQAHREQVERALAADVTAPAGGTVWFASMEEALERYEAFTGMDIPWEPAQ